MMSRTSQPSHAVGASQRAGSATRSKVWSISDCNVANTKSLLAGSMKSTLVWVAMIVPPDRLAASLRPPRGRRLVGRDDRAQQLEGRRRLVVAAGDVGQGRVEVDARHRLRLGAVDVRRWRSSRRPARRCPTRAARGRGRASSPRRRPGWSARRRPARPPGRRRRTAAPICWIVTRRSRREHDRVGQVPPVEADEVGVAASGWPVAAADDERRAAVGRRRARPCPTRCRRSPRARCRRSSGSSSSPSRYTFTSPSPYHAPSSMHPHADVAAEEPARPAQAVGDDEVAAHARSGSRAGTRRAGSRARRSSSACSV